MNYKAVYLKRIIPFFLTFAVGLFIASFFVTIAAPSFKSERKIRKYRKYQKLRMENHRLKKTSCWMGKRIAEQEKRMRMREKFENEFKDDFDVPPPPMLPARPHHGR